MYYAYYLIDSKISGICDSWDECNKIVYKKNAKYKKFENKTLAKNWLESGFSYDKPKFQLDSDAIYFDAGTGRKIGVEVRITDFNGNSLLKDIMPSNLINEWGNYQVDKKRTNNFGELTGAFLALKYALKYNIKKIYGDSKLVIEYWLNLRYNYENLNDDTINLIKKTNKLYEKFKLNGGSIKRISGDINPADLGFHK